MVVETSGTSPAKLVQVSPARSPRKISYFVSKEIRVLEQRPQILKIKKTFLKIQKIQNSI